MNISGITEDRIKEAKALADTIWEKHIDNNMQFEQEDAKRLISAIWLLNGMYEADVRIARRENNHD
jgi:hypothetical protein